MFRKITLIFAILTSLVLAETPIKFTPYAAAAKYIGKGKPVMLEVGTESCVNCKKMNAILAPIMAKHPSYRIYDIILKAPAVNILDSRPQVSIADQLHVSAIPAQIFYDAQGKEVYRNVGILNASQLNSIFAKLNF